MIGWLLLGVIEKSKEGKEIAAKAAAAVSGPDFLRSCRAAGPVGVAAAGTGPEGSGVASARGRSVAPLKRFARHQKVARLPPLRGARQRRRCGQTLRNFTWARSASNALPQ